MQAWSRERNGLPQARVALPVWQAMRFLPLACLFMPAIVVKTGQRSEGYIRDVGLVFREYHLLVIWK